MNRTPAPASDSHHIRQASLFIAANWFLVTGIALGHNFSTPSDLSTELPFNALVGLVTLEVGILLGPAILCLWLLHPRLPRLARQLVPALVLSVVTLYVVDLLLYISIKEHALSAVSWNLMRAVAPNLPDYVSGSTAIAAAFGCALFIGGQISLWLLAGAISRRFIHRLRVERPWAAATLVGGVAILAAVTPLRHWSRTIAEIRKSADRHPITATGWIRTPTITAADSDLSQALLGRSMMLGNADRLLQIKRAYQDQRVETKPPEEDLPDVVIILSECIRAETLSQQTTPNLWAQLPRALHAQNHWSGGNVSNYGFFSLLTGLDAGWFEQAEELPLGLFSMLQDAGYETGFFGFHTEAAFASFHMETFIRPDRFDTFVGLPDEDERVRDKKACYLSNQFLNRTGPFAVTDETQPQPSAAPGVVRPARRRPRAALVYLFAPHWEYFHDPQDAVHLPESEPATTFVLTEHSRPLLLNRHLNSVHFVDRIIAPLLTEDRLILFTGDHGESFGDDGRAMHGTALSDAQCRVDLMLMGPGIPAGKIGGLTSHIDILPTIADALGLTLSHPDATLGASLLSDPIPDRVLTVRSYNTDQTLFVGPAATRRYIGFYNMASYTFSPASFADENGDRLSEDKVRDGPHPMLQWAYQTLGPEFNQWPQDAQPLLIEALASAESSVRLIAVRAARKCALPSQELISAVTKLTEDENAEIQQETVETLLILHRKTDASKVSRTD